MPLEGLKSWIDQASLEINPINGHSAIKRSELLIDQPANCQRIHGHLTSGAKRREHRLSTKFSPDGGANVRLST